VSRIDNHSRCGPLRDPCLPTCPPRALSLRAVSRHLEVKPVGLLVLLALVFFVYFLGEHAGRESPTRNKQVQDIASAETQLENLKTNLHATTTSPWLYLIGVLVVIYLILKMFGMWHDDDDRYYHRRRH
jgi:hypothetical protein